MDKNDKYQPLIDDKQGKNLANSPTVPKHTNHIHHDPLRVPPDFKTAEAHKMATRIAKVSTRKTTVIIDECSGLPVDNDQLGLCCDTGDLNFLSPGYPLYFQFIKFCIIVGMTIVLASGIYNIQTFMTGTACIDEAELEKKAGNEDVGAILSTCPANTINRMSLANKVGEEADLEKSDIYNFFTILLLLLIMQFLRKIQKQSALLADERAITASDYTIKVTNLPKNFKDTEDIDEEIKKFFIDKALDKGKKANVQKVIVCYNCEAKVKEQQKLKQDIKTKAKLQAQKAKKLVSDDEIRKLDAQMEASRKKIEDFNKKFRDGVGVSGLFEGEAYVTFETQRELQDTLKHWKLSGARSLAERFRSESVYKFKGNLLKVKQAPEPSDVHWENAGVPYIAKLSLKLITNVVTLVLLAAGFYLIIMINTWKVKLLEELGQIKAQNANFNATFLIKAVSIGASCVIVLINQILRAVLLFLTHNEKQSTYTEFQSNFAIRLALCQFLNTSLVTFFVAILFHNIAGPGGLIYTSFFIFITNIVVQWGMALFSPATLMHWWKTRKLSQQKENYDMTQEELNEAFRYPEFDFATKYAGYAKTIMSAAFFAPLIPMVSVVATIGIIGEYWLDKWVMLRHRARGRAIGPELSSDFIEFLEYCMVLFSFGNFLANVHVTGYPIWEEKLTLLGTGIGILNALLPMDKINEALFPGKDEAITEDKYSEIYLNFAEDYDRANPATEDMATEDFAEKKEKQKLIQGEGGI